MKLFKNNHGQLRAVWWVAVFFLVLASLTFPLVLLSQRYGWEITITHQAFVVIIATWISQRLRRKSMTELFGKFNLDLCKNGLLGLGAGALLMLLPALFLTAFSYVNWKQGTGDLVHLLDISISMFFVAVAEEVLFRGFIFQQLRKATGVWIAQVLIAGYFLLTHMNNPGMTGNTTVFASINIFLASVMFGVAYIKTQSLIMPIAFHFMANWMQGTILGFGVSGNEEASVLQPVFRNAPQWLTGGSFGLEASMPGLIVVILLTILLYNWKLLRHRADITLEKYNTTKAISN